MRVALPVAMRIAGSLIVVALAGCGTEQGAYLTLAGDARGATTYDLVLASPDLIPVIDPQRVTPTGTSTETVTYYLQKTEVAAQGTLDGVDHFSILVEPNGAPGPYIPFVVLHDGGGAIVGLGTFRATPGGPPAAIVVKAGEVDRYDLAIESVAEVDGSQPVDAGDAMRVECAAQDRPAWTSGVVWRPTTGGEIRLLLADPTTGGDATMRKLDMDCDDHEVAPNDTAADCDDTRARFHAGAAEACDMEDTNCDDVRTIAVPCQPTNTSCGAMGGVALCDDTTGTIAQSCAPDPTCACAAGANTTGCAMCTLAHETNAPPPGETVPCQPGIGQLSVDNYCSGGAPCTVEVLDTRGGWEAKVATSGQVPFAQIAVGVGSNFALRVRRPEGQNAAIPGAPGHQVGTVDLDVIDSAGMHHYFGVALFMDTTDAVCPIQSSYSMPCSS
jgi:hypothetical protein